MTNTYLTGNPLGSTAPKDLYDNSSNFDEGLNSPSPSFLDRFSKRRETWAGMEAAFSDFLQASGYVYLGEYAAGLTFTRRNQYMVRSGVAYRPAVTAALPLVMTGIWATDQVNLLAFDTDTILRADLASGAGASMIGFLQSGASTPVTLEKHLNAFVLLEDYGVVDKTGDESASGSNTSVMVAALSAAAAAGKGLWLPEGVISVNPFSLPSTLKGLRGSGKYATVLHFNRSASLVSGILVNAQNNTANPEIYGFTIDCDDPVFKTAEVAVLPLTNTHYPSIDDIRIVGRGSSGIVTQNSKGMRIYDYTCDCTGATDSTMHFQSFSSALYGTNCDDSVIVGMTTSGFPAYSGNIGISNNCKFIACHSGGTGGGFGYSFGKCSNSSMIGCTALNTSHEAFQLTETKSCVMTACHAEWEGFNGQDAGMSVAGAASDSARMNVVIGNTFINSHACGLMVAGNAQHNLVAFNTVKDCGIRGTASGTGGTNGCAIGQYTDLAGQQCVGNKFVENMVLIEGGVVNYGYGEFNLGAGASIIDTHLRNNSFVGGINNRYLAPSASKRIWDVDALAFVPVVAAAAGGGTITAFSVNSASFRRDGDFTDMQIDISITAISGSILGLLLTWAGLAPQADVYQGFLPGIDVTSAKMVGGLPSGSGVVVKYYDGTNPAIAGARIVISGRYRNQ